MNFAIELTPKAERELRKLERSAQLRIKAGIELLSNDPLPPAAAPMVGQPHKPTGYGLELPLACPQFSGLWTSVGFVLEGDDGGEEVSEVFS